MSTTNIGSRNKSNQNTKSLPLWPSHSWWGLERKLSEGALEYLVLGDAAILYLVVRDVLSDKKWLSQSYLG